MNVKLFNYYQAVNGESRQSTAKLLGVRPETLSNKLNQKRGAVFTIKDVALLQREWNLSNDDVVNIFYK